MDDTAQRVAQAIYAGLGLGVALAIFFYLSHRTEDYGPTRWDRWKAWYLMSRAERRRTADSVVAPPEFPANNKTQHDPQLIAIEGNERNALLFAGKADALAAMVYAGKIGETEGIKLVFGVGPSSTNKTYLTAREMLKARLARLQPTKPLTPEQAALRTELGLPNHKGT